jgi:hypothetical protein
MKNVLGLLVLLLIAGVLVCASNACITPTITNNFAMKVQGSIGDLPDNVSATSITYIVNKNGKPVKVVVSKDHPIDNSEEDFSIATIVIINSKIKNRCYHTNLIGPKNTCQKIPFVYTNETGSYQVIRNLKVQFNKTGNGWIDITFLKAHPFFKVLSSSKGKI